MNLIANASLDLVQNLFGVFRSRIIARGNDNIAKLRRKLAHNRTLAMVSIAAATEHRYNFAFDDLPRRLQDVLNSVGGVRVVDYDFKGRGRKNSLETAGHALKVLQSLLDDVWSDILR